MGRFRKQKGASPVGVPPARYPARRCRAVRGAARGPAGHAGRAGSRAAARLREDGDARAAKDGRRGAAAKGVTVEPLPIFIRISPPLAPSVRSRRVCEWSGYETGAGSRGRRVLPSLSTGPLLSYKWNPTQMDRRVWDPKTPARQPEAARCGVQLRWSSFVACGCALVGCGNV